MLFHRMCVTFVNLTMDMKMSDQLASQLVTQAKQQAEGRQSYLQGGVCVRVMVGQVADILLVCEVYGKSKSVKGCSFTATSWTKVISEKYILMIT